MLQEVRLPELGENITSADIVKILVAKGETVEPEQALLELETDKASFDLPSPIAGTIQQVKVREGESAKVGQVIFIVEQADGADTAEGLQEITEDTVPESDLAGKPEPAPAIHESPGAAPEAAVIKSFHGAPAAPSVRRLAREIGVKIGEVQGSGARGRITTEDIKAHAKQRLQEIAGGRSGTKYRALPDFSIWGEIERVPMSTVRRRTAENMEHAWSSVASVTQYDKADITSIEALRKKHGVSVESAGGKLTLTAIMIRILATALRKFPAFNSSVDMESREIILKKYCNIGVAVETERGLLVPVIRDADSKNVLELSVELTDLSNRARNRKLMPDEMQGASITVTNLGGIGGTGFSPLVNPPEVAILGVSRASMEPVFSDGQFVARLILPISLTYDHRVIDGADAARFLRWIASAIEEPFLLALEG